MRFSLYRKLLMLLLLVIIIALSSSILLRNFVIRDFKAFGEGRMLDRIYQLQAVLEGQYEHGNGWQRQQVRDELVRAWHIGIELKLYDAGNRLVMDTDQALAELPPVMKQRVIASSDRRPPPDTSLPLQSYPLFLDEKEIGHIDVRLPRPVHEAFFIQSSNRFLYYSVIGLGIVALCLSFLFARRISRPLKELTTAAEKLAAGEPGGQVDVSSSDEIGRLATTFNRMSEALSSQDRMRRQLVSNAAHELRTPLMVIRGELEGMMDGLLPVTPEALQSLHDEATRLANILDGVDELTRAQAASINLNLQQTELIGFFSQVLSRFASQAAEQKIRIAVGGDKSLKASIDRDCFTRIIINLANNAFRAMPRGGQFDIEVTRINSFCINIDVMDTGCGIPPEEIPHIFERFHKGKDGGLGLGLAIVKELVEAHGGEISVASEPEKGACFLIELPCKQLER